MPTCLTYPQPISKIRCATQTREYPTTAQAAAASGANSTLMIRDDVLGGWVDDHVVSEVFELGHQPPGVRFVASAAVPVSA